ncbi:MAG: hypothetical protein Athens101410_458 [Parcubacteria group bacterium Athens1014_10]|nr:MAG: hypothetical protein Athens101410_458 [Parcubacteria group bacterium Athens1014_10]TSD05234.1 MAG: hypothetical protein Athens071412_432 [Parcubacteria group bacterium Athens0714_12]
MEQDINIAIKKGFTLIELIVTISIMTLLITLSMANYKEEGVKNDVNFQAQKFSGVLKEAQIMALTGEKVDGSRPASYGVYILDFNTYILFADKDGSYSRNVGDKDIKSFDLPRGVNIDSIGEDAVFIPPSADIYIGPALTTHTFKFNFNARCRMVYINSISGRIDIENCP